jgi:hypothetical protein
LRRRRRREQRARITGAGTDARHDPAHRRERREPRVDLIDQEAAGGGGDDDRHHDEHDGHERHSREQAGAQRHARPSTHWRRSV